MPARDGSIVAEDRIMDRARFLQAMSSLAGTIHVVATVEDGRPIGVIATSVCSLSADPPSLIVCLSKSTSAHDPILRQRFFTVSALSASQADVARKFMTAKGPERFGHESWKLSPGRVPVLAAGLASFDCRLANHHDGYSHSILIGEVLHVDHAPSTAERDCLMWHLRKFARPSEVATSGN
jgi:flavin reductase